MRLQEHICRQIAEQAAMSDRLLSKDWADMFQIETFARLLASPDISSGTRSVQVRACAVVVETAGRQDQIVRSEIAAWQMGGDQINAKIDGQLATDSARVNLKRLYPTFQV